MQLVTGYNVLPTHYSLIKKVLEDHYNTLNSGPRKALHRADPALYKKS